MSKDSQQSLLFNFFAAWFNQDWGCDYDTAQAVVNDYMRTAEPGEIRELGDAILDYLKCFTSDEELEKRLLADLGCYYYPGGEGLSTKAWLTAVADQLLTVANDLS